MGKEKKPAPIRLTNRTAIGLRKTAQRVKGAWLVGMGLVTMVTTVIAVYLGFLWLPAVPLTMMAGGCVIVLMMIASRSRYLLLISQAICTEAASRQMDEQLDEKQRRRRAIEQLAAMRADVRDAQRGGAQVGMRGEESLLFDLLTGRDAEEETLHRRPQKEDEELFGEPDAQEEEESIDWEVDLYPPRKNRNAPAPASPAFTGSTKPVVKPAAPQQPVPVQRETAQEAAGRTRRRRRSADAGSAPLQLIRNDQAQ